MENRDDMDVADGSGRVQRARNTMLKLQSKQADERKIDRIEDRLTGIETVLESLAAKFGNLDVSKDASTPSSQQKSSGRFGKSPHSSNDFGSVETPAPFEGEMTLNSQSEFAREYLEHVVHSTPSIGQNADIKAALSTLQNMVSNRQAQEASSKSESQPFLNPKLADIDASKLERPPWEAVDDVLSKASAFPTMAFAVIFPFLKLDNLKDIFKMTFDSPKDASVPQRVLVYGVLHYLFSEFASYPLLGRRVHNYRSYAAQSQTQLETAMSQLPIFLPASYENVLALLLASSYAIELSKPTMCWALITNAAAMCMNLGYHRISSMKDDSEELRESKMHVFWFIYSMDRTISLRLGRAPFIQDWDVSLPYPSFPNVPHSIRKNKAPGSQIELYWIHVAQVQGQTYERLFSPAAFLKPEEERAQIATELVAAMDQAWKDRGEASVLDFALLGASLPESFSKTTSTSPNETDLPSKRELSPLSDAVMHYSTVTLIQRAVSPDNVSFNHDCLQSARAALAAHHRCNLQFNVRGNEELWSGYVLWSILQAPFTPFIVVFCNAITQCDPTDLGSLSDFVLSLEPCRTIAEGADKLYKMCHLFLQVAKIYVEAKTKEKEAHQASTAAGQDGFYDTAEGGQSMDFSTMTQFDPYLSALGLVPNSGWPLPAYPAMEGFQGMDGLGTGVPGGQAGSRNTVQDWFSGSRYIMGLMEDDVNMPDLTM
ncbi:hypothetical protein P154DRAFT_547189 [Amniculicola lignicola CBS 123094]|uniref:Xylanolytic transcriptional activator regulatory domain-containing protein n=1 Tax=Amniculicola lignicola CBS 123094 TaxID=1392246 RepID=A0A6A5W752_9PLEO|nr:hypothetical protein P154DRAFT_547189 [Amniculicola lignicola CBS 123094]